MTSSEASKSAYILRIKPSGVDRMKEALSSNEVILGWSHLPELLNEHLTFEQYREIVKQKDFPSDTTYRTAGAVAGHLWRFIREMKPGDYVVVPHEAGCFYVAEVSGKAYHDPAKMEEDTAYRRPVKWLNEKKALTRSSARAALQSKMHIRQTSAYADNLVPDIELVLQETGKERKTNFDEDLHARLIRETLDEIRTGKMNYFAFQRLVKRVLENLGAAEVLVRGGTSDKGVDLLATFEIAHALNFTLGVQTKNYTASPPTGPPAIEDLRRGMDAEGVDRGWVVTSGTFSSDAVKFADNLGDEEGLKIELYDGQDLASLIVQSGWNRGSQE